jgi:hypothetical protein
MGSSQEKGPIIEAKGIHGYLPAPHSPLWRPLLPTAAGERHYQQLNGLSPLQTSVYIPPPVERLHVDKLMINLILMISIIRRDWE